MQTTQVHTYIAKISHALKNKHRHYPVMSDQHLIPIFMCLFVT